MVILGIILFALLCCYVSKDKGSAKIEVAIMSIMSILLVVGIINWF